ncbi:MAG: adenosine deaminase [Chloroflexi bacterium]|jgi:adenosine deaminase|nr:adenosine deaminase [Chloroflexota bacterium]
MDQSLDFYQSLPKVELHRHLEGSLRVETLADIGREHNFPQRDTSTLRPLVQIGEDEPHTFENFLSKFAILRLFYRTPDVIGRITREAIADAAADNIRYLELRFTPVALSKAEGFPLGHVMDWVVDGALAGQEQYGVVTRLIASVNRHESPDLAEQVVWLAMERKNRGIIGLDLAGNEAEFPAQPFEGIFLEAKQEGLGITIHAGEWAGAENVVEAITEFGSTRIGHGVRVMENETAVALARERKTVFEVCITSNHQSGVVKHLRQHPFPQMLKAGLNATIHTDDPSISKITLGNEYFIACEKLGLSLPALSKCILSAAQASFLPSEEKAALVERLRSELNEKIPPA